MSGFTVYTATDVSIIFGPTPCGTLVGPDEFLLIEKAEDDNVYEASADGGGTLSVLRNTKHKITLTLKKTSPVNKALSAIHKAGRLAGQGVLILPLTVVDRGSNGDLFATAQAWVEKFPDESYGKQVQDVEWIFGAHDPERFIGGH